MFPFQCGHLSLDHFFSTLRSMANHAKQRKCVILQYSEDGYDYKQSS